MKQRQVSVGVLTFTRFGSIEPGSLAIQLSEADGRCGIYWLTFDDGSEYVGLSTTVIQRLGDHRRHQLGRITSFAFAPAPASEPRKAERWLIEERDRAGAVLRNKDLTLNPAGTGTYVMTMRDGVDVTLPWERAQRTPPT